MKKGYVTLLTPSYNNGGLIHRLLDSVLQQTYPNIEMIIINDGSTDNTEEIIDKYQPLFKQRGFSLRSVYQENVGLSGSINNGIKLVEGEYLLWPDADDWYAEPDSIMKMVSLLSQTDNSVGVLRCGCNYIDESDGTIKEQTIYDKDREPKYLFADAIYLKNGFRFTAGATMIKTEFLDRYISHREIYTCRYGGQNIQIMFPYLYYSKCVTISEYLYNILIRSDSHGRGSAKSYEEKKRRSLDYYNTYNNTIKQLNTHSPEEKQEYLNHCAVHHYKGMFAMAATHGVVKDMRKAYHELQSLNYVFSYEEKVRYLLSYLPGGNSLFSFYGKVKSKLNDIYRKKNL